MNRILVIDDEPQIRRFLGVSLSSQGYQVLEACNAEQGIRSTALERPDLVVLDLGLPDKDGQQVLLALREFYAGPIMVLSVRDREQEKVLALDHGANDYVTKPFGIKEFLARIRRLLNDLSAVQSVPAVFDDGHLQFDLAERQVRIEGQPLHLTPKEFELLSELYRHRGRLVTQQQLLQTLWGPHHDRDGHYLRVLVGKLRAKLGDNAADPRYLQTEPGVGYRFAED